MSFIGSILASIGGSGEQSLPTRNEVPRPTGTNASKPKSLPTNAITQTVAPKRKAEGDLNNVPSKAQRTGLQPALPRLASISRPTNSVNSPKTPVTPTANLATSRGSTQVSASGGAMRTGPRGIGNATAVSPAVSKPAQKPVAKSASAPSTAPKKGSYLDILARAKAAQESKAPVGTIKHKPVERLTKKERLAQLVKAKNNKQGSSKDRKAAIDGAPRTGNAVDKKVNDANEGKKKVVNAGGYQGTMRPVAAEPSYKGTMNKGSSGPLRNQSDRNRITSLPGKSKDRGRYGGYDSYSDEEEEEEEEYASDVSSDMEAGAFDLDLEEEESLRFARREDADALREEAELKRQKEERRQSLAKLASDASRKKRF